MRRENSRRGRERRKELKSSARPSDPKKGIMSYSVFLEVTKHLKGRDVLFNIEV